MSFVEMLLIAIGLGADAFSVALGIGAACEHKFGQEVRLAASFGLFQGVMPVIGWLLGAHVLAAIAAWDHWIAFGILLAVGLHMIVEALCGHEEPVKCDHTRGKHLLFLSVATSIDALGVGVAFGLQHARILIPCFIIAVVAALMTYVGYHFGRRLSSAIGRQAEVGGGLILIGIGVRMLWQM